MNSEELERSLRSEFENYLKGMVAELKQETTEFQQRITAEFDRQRQAIDEAFAAFSARFDSESSFDEAFTASVSEHLRLARDEGAKITATAFAEAEKLEKETAQQQLPSYDAIRDAVSDISSKDSQSSILKSLVTRAAEFAPRGAFFIIKNEHLAGWKVFGDTSHGAEDAVREVHFPVEANSILGAAIKSADTVEGSAGDHPGDTAFLDPLEFGHPNKMYAVPLVARGRAVAVLYADGGNDGAQLSREALETLVKVAGLTVELHAAAGAHPAPVAEQREEQHQDLTPTSEHQAWPSREEQHDTAREPSQSEEPSTTDFSFSESVSYEGGFPGVEPQTDAVENYQTFEHAYDAPSSGFQEAAPEWQPHEEPAFEQSNGSTEAAIVFEATEQTEEERGFEEAPSPFEHPVETTEEYNAPEPQFESSPEIATVEPTFEAVEQFDTAPQFGATPQFEPVPATPFGSFETVPAAPPAVEKSVVPVPGSRLSDRPVDLPIEVPEEERRSHNDARRFARLLVSEIKLYNEKKVLEGRQSRDLYQRLQEAIDRSREMYDKRVQPPVAAKFDYFHYELVNSLAEGEPGRLGNGYPGPSV